MKNKERTPPGQVGAGHDGGSRRPASGASGM